MVELLGTYTTENASQAREEAQRCIVASLADPQTFLLDRLLQLTPVKFLERELIHDLLKIFVSDRLEVGIFYDKLSSFYLSLLAYCYMDVLIVTGVPIVLQEPPRVHRQPAWAESRCKHAKNADPDLYADCRDPE